MSIDQETLFGYRHARHREAEIILAEKRRYDLKQRANLKGSQGQQPPLGRYPKVIA